jgi:DNA (cytosine-5)-methyltransferase 1
MGVPEHLLTMEGTPEEPRTTQGHRGQPQSSHDPDFRVPADPPIPPLPRAGGRSMDGTGHPRPRILDLMCGAGGAGMGYHLAGFEVVGVDSADQPNYPFVFHRADALAFLDSGWAETFDAIHASPPCPRYSSITRVTGTPEDHPDLIEPVRERLRASGLPYIIENVERSPLLDPVTVCGVSLGRMVVEDGRMLVLKRHRLFESNVPLLTPPCRCRRGQDEVLGVYGGGTRQWTRRGNPSGGSTDKANLRQARALMGMPWASRQEMTQAIPPSYTELLGHQLLAAIQAEEVAA